MDETEAAVVAAPVRFERPRASQDSLIDRLEKCRDRVRVITEKLTGPRPRPTNIEQKKFANSIDLLERELNALEESL